jgi:hypothetical protein
MRALFVTGVILCLAVGCLVVTDDYGSIVCTKDSDCPPVAGYACFSGGVWPQRPCLKDEKRCACELLYPPPEKGYGDGGADAGPVPDYCTEIKPVLLTQCLYTCHSRTQHVYIDPQTMKMSPPDLELETWDDIDLPDGSVTRGVHTEVMNGQLLSRVYNQRDMPPPDFDMTRWDAGYVNLFYRWLDAKGPLGDGGCEHDGGQSSGDGGMVSFMNDLVPMFQGNCGCHMNASPPAGLDLTPANAYYNLVTNGQVSPGCNMGNGYRVAPNNVNMSQLWLKTANNPGKCNDYMPPPDSGMGPLRVMNPAAFNLIDSWIRAGALNN